MTSRKIKANREISINQNKDLEDRTQAKSSKRSLLKRIMKSIKMWIR